MRIELLNTGSELLLGTVINTHASWIASQLFPLGLRIARQVTVPDGPAIREALEDSMSRSDVVLVTGGLGPTSDDLTRDSAADLLGHPLLPDPNIEKLLRERFARRGLDMPPSVLRQALVPAGARVLPNTNGTAPGLHLPPVRSGTPHLFLLPGPPRELQPMFLAEVVPTLRALSPSPPAECRILRVTGLGESQVEERIADPLDNLQGLELGYCARPGEVDIRLVGPPEVLTAAETLVRARLGSHIFAEGSTRMEEVVVRALASARATLAVAESCTGGLIAHRITDVPGASAVFLAGYVTYATAAKCDILGVNPDTLRAHGAVSEPVARAMAEGARARSGACHALAATGVAGPGGGTPEKPVGTCHLALASEEHPTLHLELRLSTDRPTFKFMASQAALDLLRRRLAGHV